MLVVFGVTPAGRSARSVPVLFPLVTSKRGAPPDVDCAGEPGTCHAIHWSVLAEGTVVRS
jgi:hypothetical protein